MNCFRLKEALTGLHSSERIVPKFESIITKW